MKRVDLLRTAERVARVIGPEDCLLVGGLAVGAHGYVRATTDVDFVTRSALAEVRHRLMKEGIPAVLAQGDALEGDFPCVKGKVAGVRVDVIPLLVPIEWDRAIAVLVGKRTSLRVVDLEGLIRLKLRAGGQRDLMDVAALVLRHPEEESRAVEFARAYGLAESIERWLGDPRLRAEILETKASRALERLAKRLPASRPRRRG